MSETTVTEVARLTRPRTTTNRPRLTLFLFVGVLIFLWAEFIKHFAPEWSLNPQYGYGWFVPFLALFLLWQQWPYRPPPKSPASRVIPGVVVCLCALLFLPIRFLAEANPDWRLLGWALALVTVTISILFFYLPGGRPWARHFAFPFLFCLVAVPWPTRFEESIIQGLMRTVTAINVAALNLIGVPALQHGNLIEVATGFLGVEEACSGVRSLQATLMISLFLGALYSFSIGPRIFLVVAGAVFAFVCNVGRTALLVWVGATRGLNAIDSWHDPAGLVILLLCFLALWALGSIIRRHAAIALQLLPVNEARAPVLPVTLIAATGIWLILAETGVQAWYGSRQAEATRQHWTVVWPASELNYKEVAVPPLVAKLLHYSEGGGATWQATDGHNWIIYFFRWLPGRTAARFVKIHRPDICLPATGLRLLRDDGIRPMTINGFHLPLRSYLFDDNGRPLHVFYSYWDVRSSYESVDAAVQEDWTPHGRLRAALRGQREAGAQMLEIAVWDYQDDGEARSALEHELRRAIAAVR